MDGSPLEPTGNPLLDGVGPGGYAERPNYPDLTIDGHPRIVPLRVAPDFHVSPEDTDPRGLAVLGCDGLKGGTVTDIWVDRSEQLIRYLEVSTGSGFADRSVLLPMQMCIVDGGGTCGEGSCHHLGPVRTGAGYGQLGAGHPARGGKDRRLLRRRSPLCHA
jgi:photosynthetic reaction center H subunit